MVKETKRLMILTKRNMDRLTETMSFVLGKRRGTMNGRLEKFLSIRKAEIPISYGMVGIWGERKPMTIEYQIVSSFRSSNLARYLCPMEKKEPLGTFFLFPSFHVFSGCHCTMKVAAITNI